MRFYVPSTFSGRCINKARCPYIYADCGKNNALFYFINFYWTEVSESRLRWFKINYGLRLQEWLNLNFEVRRTGRSGVIE